MICTVVLDGVLGIGIQLNYFSVSHFSCTKTAEIESLPENERKFAKNSRKKSIKINKKESRRKYSQLGAAFITRKCIEEEGVEGTKAPVSRGISIFAIAETKAHDLISKRRRENTTKIKSNKIYMVRYKLRQKSDTSTANEPPKRSNVYFDSI